MNKNDLHVLAANAGAGKTLTSLELAICLSIGSGFMDQQEGRGGQKRKVLFIATDGGGSAWSMISDYCDELQSTERGAEIVVWAEDPEVKEAAWNVSLPNLERLAKEVAKEDYLAVFIDTANACFQGAGISPYMGPVDQYLRLLKAIVCPKAALWINCHTTRSGQGMKAVAGHPAWQEVPSAVHRIERLKKEGNEADVYKWSVEKLRGESPRSFNYQFVDSEFKLVEGSHFQESIGDLLLREIYERQKAGLPTKPSELAAAIQKNGNTIRSGLKRLRQQRLIKSKGSGNHLTELGLALLADQEKPLTKAEQESFF
jgi:RecA-family ATPase